MPKKPSDFRFETELVDAFLRLVGDGVDIHRLSQEFDYCSGKTDVVGVGHNERVHAFEAKLKNWKVALHQARRNTCYAHYSYVVLPDSHMPHLGKHVDFARHGVGLICVSHTEMRIAVPAQEHEPLMPWVTSKAVASTEPLSNATSPTPVNRRRRSSQ